MIWINKIKRNQPCWCGSLKKYKNCHLLADEQLHLMYKLGYEIPPRSLIKSKEDISGIRKSCNLTKAILDELNNIIKEGVSTNEINEWVYKETLKNNAVPAPLNYKGFPKSICTSINEVVCHGIPSDYKLKDGDIINVDVTCILNGYYGDSCRMYEVGSVSESSKKLIHVTKECLDLAIKSVKPYKSINIIGDTIEKHAQKYNYGVVSMFGGHGIGKKFHEEPFVYHCKRKENLMVMLPGMIFTIEPMINEGTGDCMILEDGWTAITKDKKRSAQWEHTILVTDDGAEILT
tara:strand:- start:2826 stop:3698 length:873 start_codon:yes stop_codon:yes gene_type:complete